MSKDGLIRLKGQKGLWLLGIGLLAGLALIVIGSVDYNIGRSSDSSATTSSNTENIGAYGEELELKLKTLISSVKGVENVSVMITLDSSSEYVYARNESGASLEYVISGGETILVKEITPKVRGIAVICDGGGDPVIQQRIINLLCSLFELSSARVYVTG